MDWSNFLGGFVIGITVAIIFDVARGYLASRPSKKDMTVEDLVELFVHVAEIKPYNHPYEDDDRNTTEMDNDQPLVAPTEEDHRVE